MNGRRSARRGPVLLLASTVGALLLAACTGPERRGGWTVRDSAGITIVENDHTRPVWREDEAWRLSAEPVVRIGTVEGEPTEQLFRAVHSTRLSDGSVAVANAGTREVRIYGPDGAYERTIGREGEGPGEFQGPWAVHEIRGDSILVIDLYQEVAIFDRDGTFGRDFVPSRPEGQAAQGEGFEPVGQFGDGTLLFRHHHRWSGPQPTETYRNRISMIRVGLDGEMLGSLGDFDDQTIAPPCCLLYGAWAKEAPADTTMWYGPGDRFEMQEVAFDGRRLRLVRLDRPARPVTEEDREVDEAPGPFEYSFADSFPHHYDLFADADDNLWVQEYRPFDEPAPRDWSVFDPEGHHLGTVTLPARFDLHEIGRDYVLGRWRDELDVEYIHLYRLEKPGEAEGGDA